MSMMIQIFVQIGFDRFDGRVATFLTTFRVAEHNRHVHKTCYLAGSGGKFRRPNDVDFHKVKNNGEKLTFILQKSPLFTRALYCSMLVNNGRNKYGGSQPKLRNSVAGKNFTLTGVDSADSQTTNGNSANKGLDRMADFVNYEQAD
jgi:hypothetical protein